MRSMRYARELSLYDVAKLTDCEVAALSRYERGHALPSLPTLYELAVALGFVELERQLKPWLAAAQEREGVGKRGAIHRSRKKVTTQERASEKSVA